MNPSHLLSIIALAALPNLTMAATPCDSAIALAAKPNVIQDFNEELEKLNLEVATRLKNTPETSNSKETEKGLKDFGNKAYQRLDRMIRKFLNPLLQV